ncbi:MAG: ferrochelatase, partial [Rhodobacteraceae bacterium]|nr:ferrochelatase [Paracoccaceae bacterium]
GFSSDCIETLEEIQMEVREEFEAHGGKNFAYIPALNDTDDHSDLIYRIILENLGGWLS